MNFNNNWRGNRGGGGGRWNGNGGRRPWGWRGRGRGSFRGNGQKRGGNDDTGEDGGPGLMPMPPPTSNRGFNSEDGGDGDPSPPLPPPKKKRKTKSAKEAAIVQTWEKKLPGYRLYYPDAAPQLPDIDKKIALISDYLGRRGYLSPEKMLDVDESQYFEVICEDVFADNKFMRGWPEFLEDLCHEKADEVVNLWGAVMHKLISEYFNETEEEGDGEDGHGYGSWQLSSSARVGDEVGKSPTHVGKILAGLLKMNPVIPVIKVNASYLGKFVTISGQIVGTGDMKSMCLQLPFLCKTCEQEFVVDQPYGQFTAPTRCGVSEDCDNRYHFEPCETSPKTLMIDSRKIKLQDVQNHQVEKGAVPRTIECELTGGLVHHCSTGDTVTITGIVKMHRELNFRGEQSLHSLYVEVVGMKNHRESERTAGGHWFSFSDKDYCAVREIYDCGKGLFKLLVASLCPSIYGHELVKASLVLSLFGGTQRKDDILSRRGDINVLLIGDPGIGKSQMLKVIAEVAPRAVYVCGTGSSVAGLTVTLVRDGDEYGLEAGALVMGDNGVTCIDELDKMPSQHPALLEAMEQQSVTIAKSGVLRTLPARTTVIAAANPVGGSYDHRKSICENIKMKSALLSRFDISFILLDKPNRDFDRKIVEHVMGMRTSNSFSASNSGSTVNNSTLNVTPLIDKLRANEDEVLDLIPHPLIKKYIAYARQYVNPKLTSEAVAVLKEYYLRLRVQHRSKDCIPVTTRQLESLVRLTQARAKLELREEATDDDATDVLQIFEASFSSAFDDELIAVSALSESIVMNSTGGKGKSTSSQAKRLMTALQKNADRKKSGLFTTNEIKTCVNLLGLKATAESLVALLNNEGCLLKKGPGVYQLLSVDF